MKAYLYRHVTACLCWVILITLIDIGKPIASSFPLFPPSNPSHFPHLSQIHGILMLRAGEIVFPREEILNGLSNTNMSALI